MKILMIICFSSEDEESKWLDALESGDLDDYGRLKKEKDVSLMTARQVSKTGVFDRESRINEVVLG